MGTYTVRIGIGEVDLKNEVADYLGAGSARGQENLTFHDLQLERYSALIDENDHPGIVLQAQQSNVCNSSLKALGLGTS